MVGNPGVTLIFIQFVETFNKNPTMSERRADPGKETSRGDPGKREREMGRHLHPNLDQHFLRKWR